MRGSTAEELGDRRRAELDAMGAAGGGLGWGSGLRFAEEVEAIGVGGAGIGMEV